MELINFIHWVKSKSVVTQVNPAQTLIPVGLRDNRRTDEYVVGAITVQDFIDQLNITPTPPSATAISASIWANGFTVVGCINEDITLPANSNLTYKSPLAMCVGKTLTIPAGTTLTIIP